MNTLMSTTSPTAGLRALLRWSPLVVVGSLLAACTGGDPPTVCAEVDDQVLYTGQEKLLDICFEDPEGAKLHISATSSDPEVGSIVVYGQAVNLVAVGVGKSTMTVQAEDPGGNTASIDFNLEVPNQLPFATLDEVPRTKILTEQVREYYVDDFFRDPDKDPLFFTAEIENPAVASGGMVDSLRLVINGLTVGETTVTLKATDPHGGVAELVGQILVVEPVLFWRDDFDSNAGDWSFYWFTPWSYWLKPGHLSISNRWSYYFAQAERTTDDNATEWMAMMSIAADEGSTNQLTGMWSYPPTSAYTCNTINFVVATIGYTDEIHYIGSAPGSNWQLWYYNCYPYKLAAYGETDGVASIGEFTEFHWGVQRGNLQISAGATTAYSVDASEGPDNDDVEGGWPVIHSTTRLVGLGAQGETWQYNHYDWMELWAIDAYDDAADLSGNKQLRNDPASLSPMPPADQVQRMIIHQ